MLIELCSRISYMLIAILSVEIMHFAFACTHVCLLKHFFLSHNDAIKLFNVKRNCVYLAFTVREARHFCVTIFFFVAWTQIDNGLKPEFKWRTIYIHLFCNYSCFMIIYIDIAHILKIKHVNENSLVLTFKCTGRLHL